MFSKIWNQCSSIDFWCLFWNSWNWQILDILIFWKFFFFFIIDGNIKTAVKWIWQTLLWNIQRKAGDRQLMLWNNKSSRGEHKTLHVLSRSTVHVFTETADSHTPCVENVWQDCIGLNNWFNKHQSVFSLIRWTGNVNRIVPPKG